MAPPLISNRDARRAFLVGQGLAVGVSPDGGQKYTSFFADLLGDEGHPQI